MEGKTYTIQDIIKLLEMRRESVHDAIMNRKLKGLDYSTWRYFSDDELKSSYTEITEILNLINNKNITMR